MEYTISSAHNPKIIHAIGLKNKSRTRKKTKQFIAEGLQECGMALQTRYTHEMAFYCPDFIDEKSLLTQIPALANKPLISCSPAVFGQIAYRNDVPNVVIIGNQQKHDFEQLILPTAGYVLICEGLEKPGNLGAIARSANAFGASAVILSNSLCDIYNPNALRASMGALYSVPIYYSTNNQIIDLLQANKVPTFITHMHSNSKSLHTINLPPVSAWVLGTEHQGLSSHWLQPEFQNCIIPMAGTIDSLNVSNAAAVLLYHLFISVKLS